MGTVWGQEGPYCSVAGLKFALCVCVQGVGGSVLCQEWCHFEREC